MKTILALLALLCLAPSLAEAAGVQRISVPDADGSPPLEGAVWYPCVAPPGTVAFRGVDMPGVEDCPVAGEDLPLIVISHGARGWFGGHHDTAEALADAGYVVAAVTHPDQGRRGWRTGRPAAIGRLIDHMLGAWSESRRLDAGRIGFFGFSRGGYTGLVLIGGRPNFRRLLWHCLFAWSDPLCQAPPGVADSDGSSEEETAPAAFTHDPRVRAAVIAAPLGIVFSAEALESIAVPVQLWRAEKDQLLTFPDHAEAVYEKLPTKPDYRVVPDAGHFAFLAPCSAAQAERVPAICQDAPGFDRVAFHRAFNAEVLAFFREQLNGP